MGCKIERQKMKLESLEFRRPYAGHREAEKPLVGCATFKSEDGQIALVLNETEAAQVLSICADSLARTFKAKAEGMQRAMNDAIIGNSLPPTC